MSDQETPATGTTGESSPSGMDSDLAAIFNSAMEAGTGAPSETAAPQQAATATEEKPAETTEQSQETTEETPGEEKSAPWDKDPRFIELNQNRKTFEQIKPWADAVEQLKQHYGSPEAYTKAVQEAQARMSEFERSQQQADVDKRVQEMIDNGQISEDVAPTLKDLLQKVSTLEPIAKSATQAAQERAWDQRYNALKGQFPELDEDAVKIALVHNADAESIAKRTHDRSVSIREAAVSDYAAKAQARDAEAPPVSANAGMAPAGQAAFDASKPPSLTDLFARSFK